MSTSASASRRLFVMSSSAWLGSAIPLLGWLCALCGPDCYVAPKAIGIELLLYPAALGHITGAVESGEEFIDGRDG
jgi:hypothetical protein